MTEWLPLKRFVDPSRPITYGIVQAGADVPGGVPYIRPVDMDEHHGVRDPSELRTTSPEIAASYRRSTIRQGDLVVSIGPSFGKTMIVDNPALDGANLTQGTARVSPRPGVDARFLQWTLQSKSAVAHWEASVGGATFRALNLGPLAETPIPFVGLASQRAMADFLDTETARIDALITKKRRMIELLEERFGSYIRHRLSAVSPLLPLKRRWTVVDCKHRTPVYVDDGYPVISPGDVTSGRLDLNRAHRFVTEEDFVDLADFLRRPRRGDIIYSRNASIGIAAYVDTDRAFCMGQDVCLVTSVDQDQLYLTYVLNSVGLDQLQLQKIGSTFSRVNVEQIVELAVPSPQPAVQRTLAVEFDRRRVATDKAIGRLRHQVPVLEERRQALITAAVTGELKVPGVAA